MNVSIAPPLPIDTYSGLTVSIPKNNKNTKREFRHIISVSNGVKRVVTEVRK